VAAASPESGIPETGDLTAVVADDHPAVLEAVCAYLERGGVRILGRAADGDQALDLIGRRRPRVALVDLRMPRMGGIAIARKLQASGDTTPVLVYSGYGDRALLMEALDVGVRGFVLKEAPLDDLVRAVSAVAAGGTYVDPVLAGALAAAVGQQAPQLTQRERDVLRLLADGLSNEEIGKQLFISAETVRTHLRKAMDKLGAETRTQAVALALRDRLIA